jgi:alkaline phosphatase D
MATRRTLLTGAAAVLALASLSAPTARARTAPRFARNPFTLGVASGYPTASGFTLWTRLAPEPLAPDGGLDPLDLPVEWELGDSVEFRRVLRRGTAWAEATWGHSVHIDVADLEPDREYFYRFRAGDARSVVGRTRTAPAAGASPDRLRIAVASCQMYEHGEYAAYRRIVAEDTDLVVHVGDYIYENSGGVKRVRQHGSGECYTLADYRVRHSLYRLDPALAAAHASCPWLLTWDDHEVDNDYADDISEQDDDPRLFLARRAAAYQAYYEHLPLPRRAAPFGASMRLHAAAGFGDLLTLLMLDNRQYRSPHPCPPAGRRGSSRLDPSTCPEFNAAGRTMLGARQEAWLGAQLERSRARWNLLAQGLVFAASNEVAPPARRYWTDAWGGYPAARDRLLGQLETSRASNPVLLGGDIHAFTASNLHSTADDPASPIVAAELVTTSISSEGTPVALLESHMRNNPAMLLGEPRYRGWLRLDVGAERLDASMMALDDPYDADSSARTLAGFVIENGKPGLQRG